MIYLYNALTFLLLPLYFLLLLWRMYKGKENIYRIGERFSVSAKKRPSGFLIWLHGASVGESGVALTLMEALNVVYPTANFLITTGTNSSAMIIEKKLSPNAIHHFLPFDNLLIIKNFLRKWQPNLAIFIEAELWPCLINETSKKCKILLFNASISDRSFKHWMRIRIFLQQVLECFSEIITKSDSDLEKFKLLGANKVKNLGNIKFSNKQLIVDKKEFIELSTHLKNKQIIVFASTHKEDESVLLKIIMPLKIKHPDCYFILVSRHPERRDELIKACNQMKLKFKVRSQVNVPDLEDDLYIVDRFGELGLFYSLAYISFIGGSFKQGGHNPLEAAYFSNLIIFGPNMNKCRDIATSMTAQKAAIQISNYNELLQKLEYFLSNDGEKEGKFYQSNALSFLNKHKEILNDYLQVATKYIND